MARGLVFTREYKLDLMRQLCSGEKRPAQLCREHGVAEISMAAIGLPYDDALAESFFGTLKREEVQLHEYRTFTEVEAYLDHVCAAVYNRKRLHSSLSNVPPSEFAAARRLATWARSRGEPSGAR